MKTYKVTVFLNDVMGDDSDEESFKEAVKDAIQLAVDLDDNGDEELLFEAEEVDEDF